MSAQTVLASMKEVVDHDSAPGGDPFGIHFRTLGNVAYFMTSLNTPSATIRAVERRIQSTLRSPGDYKIEH